jgi:hypothetical protein
MVPAVRLGGACSRRFSRSSSSNRPARRHSDKLLVPVLTTRFARWDWPGGDGPGRAAAEPKQHDGLEYYQAKLPRFRNSGNVKMNQPVAAAHPPWKP